MIVPGNLLLQEPLTTLDKVMQKPITRRSRRSIYYNTRVCIQGNKGNESGGAQQRRALHRRDRVRRDPDRRSLT
jgi:hypothetical protein